MKEKIIITISMIMDWIVFFGATMTVAVMSYESLTGAEYTGFLTAAVMCMDYGFILSVIVQLIDRKEKKLFVCLNIANLLLILTAYIMKFAGAAYAPGTILFWDMYLMLYYGYRIAIKKEGRRGKSDGDRI